MTDLSALSNEELMAAAGLSGGNDLSSLSNEQLMAAAGITPEPKQLGFMDRLKADFAKRKGISDQAVELQQTGKISLPEAVLRGSSQGGQFLLNDLPIAAIKSLPFAQDIGELAKNGISAVASTDFGRRVAGGADTAFSPAINAYGRFKEQNPRAAYNIETVAGLANTAASALPVGKAAEVALDTAATTSKVADVAGKAIAASGDAAAIAKRNEFLKNLVVPEAKGATAVDQAGRTVEKGLLRKKVYMPDASEMASIQAVAETGVKPTNSFTKNYNIINDATNAETDALKSYLAKADKPIDETSIMDVINRGKEEALANIDIGAGGEKQAENVARLANKVIAKYPKTAAGLLQARKDFYSEVIRQRGESAFNATRDSVSSVAIQNIAQGWNDLIDNAVKDADVRASLNKQSAMLRAMENIRPKAAAEGSNIIARTYQKAKNAVSLKDATLGLLATGGAAFTGTLPVLGAAGALYGAGKLAASPITRKAIGKTLSAASLQDAFKALKKGKK